MAQLLNDSIPVDALLSYAIIPLRYPETAAVLQSCGRSVVQHHVNSP